MKTRAALIACCPACGGERAPDPAPEAPRLEVQGDATRSAWQPGRRMNGDQSHQGRHLRLPPDGYGVRRVRLYRYS
jgi:hypothetical protein